MIFKYLLGVKAPETDENKEEEWFRYQYFTNVPLNIGFYLNIGGQQHVVDAINIITLEDEVVNYVLLTGVSAFDDWNEYAMCLDDHNHLILEPGAYDK